MKKVIEVSIGGINFMMEDDAYFKLKSYLNCFEETIPDKSEAKEVMEDVEARVAEIFQKEIKFDHQVIDIPLIQIVINHLGEVEEKTNTYTEGTECENEEYTRGDKKLFRNPDDKKIAGVCSGLAAYFDIDPTLVRLLFVLTLFMYGTGPMAYIVLWIVIPQAHTVIQKLQMRGYAPTAENIRKYTSENK
ncbi:MAG: PspC domain-containing protein [Candidatus Azobacteroides sp.]|nr:PspC domain-containing protein [Candidatus Azobacteroides sp.]